MSVEVLASEQTAEAFARVLARPGAFDDNEANAVLSVRKALRLGDIVGAWPLAIRPVLSEAVARAVGSRSHATS